MSHVPQEWASLLSYHRQAQIARDLMRDRAQPQISRDQAAAAYAANCDRIVDALDLLSVRQVLGRATLLLAGQDLT